MTLIMGSGFIWSIHDLKRTIQEEALASLHLASVLLEGVMLTQDPKPEIIASWVEKIRHLDQIRHLRIEITPRSTAESLKMDRTRLSNSQVPSWFRWAVSSEPRQMIKEIPLKDAEPLYIHTESYLEDEILEAWEEMKGYLLLQIVLFGFIYGAVYIITRRALGPVAEILRGLNAIEAGDYEKKLPAYDLPELHHISHGINHLSSSLNRSRDENEALTRQSLSIQEEERRSIARELHDELGQNLTAIKMMSGMVEGHGEQEKKAISEIQQLCDHLFAVVHALMHRLRPTILDDFGLRAAIEDLVEHWRMRFPGCEVICEFDGEAVEIGPEVALQIYRITQEALTNVMRHSEARTVWIRLKVTPKDSIHLMILDNGRGFLKGKGAQGFGIPGMEERVRSLKGQFNIDPSPGQGVSISITLPIHPQATETP